MVVEPLRVVEGSQKGLPHHPLLVPRGDCTLGCGLPRKLGLRFSKPKPIPV
jgi:hypothetical protein